MLRGREPLIFAAIIVVFWAAMMALLVQREVLIPRGPALPAGAGILPDSPEDAWLGIYAPGDRRLGFIHAQTVFEPRGGVDGARTNLQGRVQLAMLGEAADLRITGSLWNAAGGAESDFDFAVRSGRHDLRVEGRIENGQLAAEVFTAGERIPVSMPMPDNPVVGSGVGGLLRMPAPKPGEEFVVTAFDPLSMSAAPTRVAYAGRDTVVVGGESIPATVVRVSSNGVDSRAWLAEDGEVLRAETPYGMTLVRITPEEANAAIDADGGAHDLLTTLAIRPSGTVPFRGAQELRFHATGLGPEAILPEDEHQRALGAGEYLVSAAEGPGTAVAADFDAEPFLAADVLVQSDHPEIRAWSKRIVGDEQDPWARAQAIYRWVYDNIRKKTVPSVPSALEVLETREGDCNEHTILFTALARAAGVPTRIAVGVVWSDELRGFYYHAWPEVYAGRWVRMDPTLGQPLADATHVKLATGGISQWAQIMPFLGRLQIEVTDAR